MNKRHSSTKLFMLATRWHSHSTLAGFTEYSRRGRMRGGTVPPAVLKNRMSLIGVAQCIERQPAYQSVPTSILNQGISLGCGPGPQ